jgi:hypothetical protein
VEAINVRQHQVDDKDIRLDEIRHFARSGTPVYSRRIKACCPERRFV